MRAPKRAPSRSVATGRSGAGGGRRGGGPAPGTMVRPQAAPEVKRAAGTALVFCPGQAFDDFHGWQLQQLPRIEKQLARTIATAHDNVRLSHDGTIDVDGELVDAKCGNAADQHTSELHGCFRVGEGGALYTEELAHLL